MLEEANAPILSCGIAFLTAPLHALETAMTSLNDNKILTTPIMQDFTAFKFANRLQSTIENRTLEACLTHDLARKL